MMTFLPHSRKVPGAAITRSGLVSSSWRGLDKAQGGLPLFSCRNSGIAWLDDFFTFLTDFVMQTDWHWWKQVLGHRYIRNGTIGNHPSKINKKKNDLWHYSFFQSSEPVFGVARKCRGTAFMDKQKWWRWRMERVSIVTRSTLNFASRMSQ